MSQPHSVSPRIDLGGLRHQLLTPLNHIVGYSEMLLEDGDTQGFDNARQNLVRIRETAKDMVRMVHSGLPAHPRKRGEKLVTDLRYELAAPLHTILQAVGAVTSEQHAGMDLNDILKIGHAATELLGFTQGGAVLALLAEPMAKSLRRPPEQTQPGRILIVDDNRPNRELLARPLKRHGHQVTEAASGSQALQILVQSPQDLVLLDMLMPKLDGFQVLERIKSDPASARIPVIVISALNEVPGIVRCLEMGAEDYLFKPIDPVLLAARVHASLERKRLHDLEKRRAEDVERAYEKLHSSEERLRLALRADGARIWDWDLAANLLIDARGKKQPLEEALSHVAEEDRARLRAAALEAAQKRQEFHCEFRVVRHGAVRWMEAMGILDGSARMIGVTRDVTPRKQAEQTLRQSSREFQRFALAASHDLREPLRAVSSDLEALLARRQTKENGRAIRSAMAKLTRMSKLIGDLLDYSQMSGKKTPKRPVSADGVFALVLTDLKPIIEESGAAVTHENLPVVPADFVLLQRVFQNLLSNAIKYRGKPKPRIHVSAEARNGMWLFRVSDNGVGIDLKDQDAIFSPFHRAHGNGVPGTGLGLAICRRIIEGFGGEIWLESSPGKGSTFYFTIPQN